MLAKHGPELTEEALHDMPFAGGPHPAAPAVPPGFSSQRHKTKPACLSGGLLVCPAAAGLVPTARNREPMQQSSAPALIHLLG